jgi:hypothetical protein
MIQLVLLVANISTRADLDESEEMTNKGKKFRKNVNASFLLGV